MNRRRFLLAACDAPLLLAAGGRSAYTISLPAGASPSQRRAAGELQHFLGRMTGATPPVAESATGPTIALKTSEEFGPEGFRLKTEGRNVMIEGGRQRGTLYGTYAFLEKLGCRWYAQDCTFVPHVESLILPALDEVQKPAFEYREVFLTEACGRDWAARNRLNGNFTELDASTGGKVAYYPFGHSFYKLVPPEKYYALHPEYYALVGGQRRATNAQLCLSNPEVVRIAVGQVLRWAEEHPEATVFSVSQNDEDAWCECPACRRIEQEEGAHSGPILHFVNAIAAAVCRRYPDKCIDTFAYRYSERPPGKVRAHPNVRVRLAPICACQAHPYEQCHQNRFVMDHLRGWSRVTDKVYVWHYITDFNQYLAPFPNLDELGHDLAMYRRHNVAGLFLQGARSKGGGGELAELRAWMLARLLWNPQLDPRALIREFLGAWYGAAAPAMQQYLDLAHHEVRLPPQGLGRSMFLYRGPAFSPAFRPEAGRLFDRMDAATRQAGETVQARRVRKERLSLEWYDLCQAKRFLLRDGSFGPADPAGWWCRYESLLRTARGYGITDFSEWGPIEVTEAEDREFVKSHATAVLQNRHLKAVVVPGFHGRIVSLVHMATGHEALRLADPDERFTALEALGGLVLYLHPEPFSRSRHDVAWQVARTGPEYLELSGVCGNGLRVHRTLELDGGSPLLRTATTVRNEGPAPIPLTLHSRVEINPGDLENPTVDFSYRRRGGAEHRQRIFPPPELPLGDLFLGGDELPDGEWRLTNPRLGLTIANRFPPGQVERCRLWWRGRRQGQANLGVWSPPRTLAPGENLKLETDYFIL
jgi:hypothetical protein